MLIKNFHFIKEKMKKNGIIFTIVFFPLSIAPTNNYTEIKPLFETI